MIRARPAVAAAAHRAARPSRRCPAWSRPYSCSRRSPGSSRRSAATPTPCTEWWSARADRGATRASSRGWRRRSSWWCGPHVRMRTTRGRSAGRALSSSLQVWSRWRRRRTVGPPHRPAPQRGNSSSSPSQAASASIPLRSQRDGLHGLGPLFGPRYPRATAEARGRGSPIIGWRVGRDRRCSRSGLATQWWQADRLNSPGRANPPKASFPPTGGRRRRYSRATRSFYRLRPDSEKRGRPVDLEETGTTPRVG